MYRLTYRYERKLLNVVRLKTNSHVLIREMLFAHDTDLKTHSNEDPQQLINDFVRGCMAFALTIQIKEINIIGQSVRSNINHHWKFIWALP